jgi:hypothetical protein
MRDEMAGGYYYADSENGAHWDDPSEDLLFIFEGRCPAHFARLSG